MGVRVEPPGVCTRCFALASFEFRPGRIRALDVARSSLALLSASCAWSVKVALLPSAVSERIWASEVQAPVPECREEARSSRRESWDVHEISQSKKHYHHPTKAEIV